MPLNLTNINDQPALIDALSQVDTTVLPRTGGRTTDQTEVYLVHQLLTVLASTDRLAFPMRVEHKDRPDIRFHMAGQIVGVELTEAVSKPWATFEALAGRENPSALLEMSHFGFAQPARSLQEQRRLLNQPSLSGSGWLNDEPEQQWALFIGQTVETKMQTLAKSGFQVYGRNWLATYDNLPLHMPDIKTAAQHVALLLEPIWLKSPMFDAVYVHTWEGLLELTQQGFACIEQTSATA